MCRRRSSLERRRSISLMTFQVNHLAAFLLTSLL
jgi:hypothetical protein